MFIIVDLPDPRTHDRHELSALDVERDALQRVHRHAAQAIVLHQVLNRLGPCLESSAPSPAGPRVRRRERREAFDAAAPALLENAATIAGSPAFRAPPLTSVYSRP